eukprot:731414_1
MNVALFSLCLILSAISTLAIEFWNVPVDDDSFNMDWAVNFTQPSYGAVNVHNATTPMCPPNGYSSNGCFEFVPPVRTTATVYTSGFMHIYLEYTIITAGLIDGEGCYIFADDGTQRAQVDWVEYGDPEDGDPNGKFNGYDLANFFGFDPTPSEITIELYAKTPNLDETYAQCFFSNLVLGGEPIISTTQFDTTTTTTSPGLTTLHDFPLNSVPDDQWTVQSLNDSGTVIEHFFDNYCSNPMNNYCWELTPSSVAEIQLDITGQIIFFIDFFIAKVGFGDGYCEFNFENYDSRTISTDDSQILTLELMGYTNDYVRIILSAIGTPTFHCEFADIIIRGIPQNMPSYEPTPSPDSQQTGFEVEPMDQVYCPWVVAGDGAPEIVGYEFCNVAFEVDQEYNRLPNSSYSYNWQCLGHRQIRYTRFTDNKCMNYDYEMDLGYDYDCPQCGYTTYPFNNEPLSFDCSNINDYGTNNCNYADWGQSTGCYPNGTLLHDGLQTQHVITDTCFMMSESTSLMAQCHESDDTFYLQFFSNDRYCEGFPSTGSFSYSCQADNAADISCHYGDIPDDTGPDVEPRDQVYCPWVVAGDGAPELVGSEFCNAAFDETYEGDELITVAYSYTWQCLGHRQIRYTRFTDNKCMNYEIETDLGYDDHCPQCGYTSATFNDEPLSFDCSNINDYGTNNCNYADWGQSTGCYPNGTLLHDGLETKHVITDACFMMSESTSVMAQCESDDTLYVVFFNDRYCGGGTSMIFSDSCEADNANDISCHYGDIPDDNNNGGGDDSWPVDTVYCPYISGQDGPASVFGPNLCQGQYGRDNRTGLVQEQGVTFECVGYGLIRYTNYSDALCTNPLGSEIAGNGEHCKGCGYIDVGDPFNFRFDCSWYGVYDETACNRVDLAIGTQCNGDGTTLNMEEQFQTMHILTDVCFSNGDSSHMLTCEGDTINVMSYNDWDCGYPNENKSFAIVQNCEEQEGVEGLAEFTCVDGDIPDNNGNDDEGESGSDVYPIDNVYCPYISGFDGPPSVIGPNLCQGRQEKDNRTGLVREEGITFECVDYGLMRYTNYSDALCTNPSGSEIVGNSEHCEGCGGIEVNDPLNLRFDCSWHGVYDETACNRVDLMISPECNDDGTTLNTEDDFMTWHILTDVCFSNGDSSHMLTCEGDTINVMSYEDGYCQSSNENHSFAIVASCEEQQGVGGVAEFTCVDGDIPDNNGNDDEGESGSDVYPIDNVY